MSSPFVRRLLDRVERNQVEQLQALEAAIGAASADPAISEEDRFKSKQLIFAIEVIAAVADGNAPWVASGPSDRDKDWALAYYKARKARGVRPAHFDPEIEELLQHVTP